MSIRARLFLALAALVVAGFTYLLHWVANDLRPRYQEAQEETMVDTACLLAALAAEQGELRIVRFREMNQSAACARFHAQIYDLLKTNVDLRVYVTDTRGIVVFDSDHGRAEGQDYSQWNDVYRTLRGQYGARATRTDPAKASTVVLHVAAPIMHAGKMLGVVSVCKPATSANLFIRAAQRKIFVAGALACLAVVVLGLAVSAWITRPIGQLTRYAEAARDGRRAPLPRLGHNEIGVMGQALEQMREALEGKHYVEQYVQTLTHELKAPLAAVQGAVELLQEEMPRDRQIRFLENICNETKRMQQLVERLLLLSSLEKRRQLDQPETLCLHELAAKALGELKLVAAARSVTLELSGDPALLVRGDAFLLDFAIGNLLRNALDFSPANGRIEIRLLHEPPHACVVITDHGPGIPEYALAKVFDRFFSLPRPDTGRKSSGLGLCIAREVALLHGGAVTLRNLPGGGAEARFQLPCSA